MSYSVGAIAINSMRSAPRKQTTNGFTLLEMLVVLSLIGLMAGIVAPDLLTMTDRIAFAMNREKLEHALAALPYEAYRQKKDLILESTKKTDDAPDEMMELVPLNMGTEKIPNLITLPIITEQVTLDMPPDWTITVPEPILYRAAGYCNGGAVDIRVGAVTYRYELRAPDCQPIAN